jgi:hypothetical protein
MCTDTQLAKAHLLANLVLSQQARVAQSVERTTLNRVVVGSSPTSGASLLLFERTNYSKVDGYYFFCPFFALFCAHCPVALCIQCALCCTGCCTQFIVYCMW